MVYILIIFFAAIAAYFAYKWLTDLKSKEALSAELKKASAHITELNTELENCKANVEPACSTLAKAKTSESTKRTRKKSNKSTQAE